MQSKTTTAIIIKNASRHILNIAQKSSYIFSMFCILFFESIQKLQLITIMILVPEIFQLLKSHIVPRILKWGKLFLMHLKIQRDVLSIFSWIKFLWKIREFYILILKPKQMPKLICSNFSQMIWILLPPKKSYSTYSIFKTTYFYFLLTKSQIEKTRFYTHESSYQEVVKGGIKCLLEIVTDTNLSYF